MQSSFKGSFYRQFSNNMKMPCVYVCQCMSMNMICIVKVSPVIHNPYNNIISIVHIDLLTKWTMFRAKIPQTTSDKPKRVLSNYVRKKLIFHSFLFHCTCDNYSWYPCRMLLDTHNNLSDFRGMLFDYKTRNAVSISLQTTVYTVKT